MADDYDFDDHGHSLEDVCDRLDNIEEAVKANRHDLGWLWVIIFGWLALAGLADVWNSKIRYSWWYSVDYDQVNIQKKPTDCNFFHAPIGDKDCHYDRQVSTVRVGTNKWGGQAISYDEGKTWVHTAKSTTGVPIVSNDNGNTWSTEYVPSNTKPQVVVSWEKVEDE